MDEVATLPQAGDEAFDRMRAVYEGEAGLKVPPVITCYRLFRLRPFPGQNVGVNTRHKSLCQVTKATVLDRFGAPNGRFGAVLRQFSQGATLQMSDLENNSDA